MKNIKYLLSRRSLVLGLLGVVWFMAGIIQDWWVFGVAGSILLLGILFEKKLILSKGLLWYLVVVFLMGATILWSEGKELVFKNLILFLLGGGWMYLGFSMKHEKKSEEELAWLITILGVGWLMIFLWNEFFVEGVRIGSRGLVWWGTHTKDHHYLGDWWALVVLSQLWLLKLGKKIKNDKVNLFLILAGIIWIYFSRSRSAILSVVLGVGFLFGSDLWKEKIYKWVVGLLVLAFLFLGMTKPTFFNRQYWLQGLVGWWRHPFGLGMGNFGKVSGDIRNHMFGLSSYSSVAHNVLLEFLVGMGVLGLVFWWWFLKYAVEPFFIGRIKPSLIDGLVLALGVNFLFNTTYFVAPMWWVFMFLLGVLEKQLETR